MKSNNMTQKHKQSLPLIRVGHIKTIMMMAAVVLSFRLFYVQVVQGNHYQNLANAEHQKKFINPAKRGSIYFMDSDGSSTPAVLNENAYTVFVDPTVIDDVDKSSQILSAALGISQQEIKTKMSKKDTAYVVVAKVVKKDVYDDLMKQRDLLKGVGFTPVPQRVYPEGSLASQTLGFVNAEGDGQYGIEGFLDDKLSGKDGAFETITDVRGVPLSFDSTRSVRTPAKDGQNIVMTIDRNVQAIAEQALEAGLKNADAQHGSVIVMDPNSGAIKAMANLPSYNVANYREVKNNAYERFQNRVVSSPYEPGSVIKVLTMAAGLDSGAVNYNSSYTNRGVVKIADAVISDVNRFPVVSMDMTDVLKYSLNTGVVHVLQQMGDGSINYNARKTLYNYFYNKYRLGSLTGVEQIGEAPGDVISPDSPEGGTVRYANMTFGQGLNITMVQTAAAFSSLVNGGHYYAPYLIEGEADLSGNYSPKQPSPKHKQIISAKTSREMQSMMYTAFNTNNAVSQYSRSGYNIGGKSGTSETIDPVTKTYTSDRTIGNYLGYGGNKNDIKYVIMIRVDDSKRFQYGNQSAGPIFGEISNKLIDYYGLSRID